MVRVVVLVRPRGLRLPHMEGAPAVGDDVCGLKLRERMGLDKLCT